MTKETAIKLFGTKQVRTLWEPDQEKWYFSIVDVIAILTETDRPRKYWNDLKTKLQSEGSELSDKIGRLKMPAADGKMRLTDVADTEHLLRLIQSIPSPDPGSGQHARGTRIRDNMSRTISLPSLLSTLNSPLSTTC